MPFAGTKLNILNISTDTFATLDNTKKVVFRLYLNNDGKMTMAFWQGDDTEFDPDPFGVLNVSGESSFAWEKNMYFGDQKIGTNKVDHIQKRIKATDTAYVVFVPTTDTDLPEQIVFSINLSNTTSPVDLHDLIYVSVTNPSPPRNSGKQN